MLFLLPIMLSFLMLFDAVILLSAFSLLFLLFFFCLCIVDSFTVGVVVDRGIISARQSKQTSLILFERERSARHNGMYKRRRRNHHYHP